MKGATHFREVFRDANRQLMGPLCEIKDLQRNLRLTRDSGSLTTIAVWRGKFKKGYEPGNKEVL